MPPQVTQRQNIPRLDLPALLRKLYIEHLRRESNYDRAVTRRATRLVKERKAELKSSRSVAKCQINERVISWIGEEQYVARPLWDYLIEKLLCACDIDIEDCLGVDVGFKDLLGDYCHAVIKNALSWKNPTRFTAWIARLDQANFGDGLLGELWKLYPRSCQRLKLPPPAGALPVKPDGEPHLGSVDRKKMQVLTYKGWIDVQSGDLLDAIKRLTNPKGEWLKNWQCFGHDPAVNTRLNKLLAKVAPAVREHIDSGILGYRWSDVPGKARPKTRKPKNST